MQFNTDTKELLSNSTLNNFNFATYLDPDSFDWKTQSWVLAQYCHRYFDTWWNADKYNWKEGSEYLVMFCSKHFKQVVEF